MKYVKYNPSKCFNAECLAVKVESSAELSMFVESFKEYNKKQKDRRQKQTNGKGDFFRTPAGFLFQFVCSPSWSVFKCF